MTIKDHPRANYTEVVEAWLPGMSDIETASWTGINPIPDRVAINNPDDVTTRWEWDTDLTTEEETAFDNAVAIALSGKEPAVYDAQQPHIDVLKLYRNSTPPTTDAQKDAAIRAIIEYLIIDRKEDLA